ncbi:aspartyl protease family protein [Allosphingosinicella flava]|uniref:Aspartyl protease family protein n=1 Tax=Allosphingosinicella flava TaxID=2771430 RepID=A0A7T2GJV8_9SPHN|nr:retroviral-like aspartic protease family protein [Sphingosinicella flava]QPQ55215.1 aspartyl protease family protein [Sphingosinicella flava]
MKQVFRLMPGVAALLLAFPALSQSSDTLTPAPSEDPYDLSLGHNRSRLTVPVRVDGQGPFNFVIDTGAERTVIGSSLAEKLRLAPGRGVTMHSMSGVDFVPTVIIPRLSVSDRKTVTGIQAPALKEAHLGAVGMLGVDSLQAQRVTFDFKNSRMTVMPSKEARKKRYGNAIVVTARSRFGRLVLVDAKLDGQKVWVVIDTGSEVSVGNSVLRARLEKRKRLKETEPVEMVSVTGERVMADYTRADELVLSGVTVKDMPIAFADVAPFEKLELTERPALLLGMDALRAFSTVSVDFAERKVRFITSQPGEDGNFRLAALP